MTTEQVTGLPVLRLVLDTEALSRYGVSSRGGLERREIRGRHRRGRGHRAHSPLSPGRSPPEEFRSDPASLERILIPTASGQRLPLTQLARFEESEGPSTIQRDWGQRRIIIQANVRGRDIGSFVEDAQKRITDGVKLPYGYSVDWGGQFENLQRAERRLYIVVPLALSLILSLSVPHVPLAPRCPDDF